MIVTFPLVAGNTWWYSRQIGRATGRHHTADKRGGRNAADASPGTRAHQRDAEEGAVPHAQVG